MLRLVMVPLDGSAFAEQALPLALAIARRADARLHLALVRPALPFETGGPAVEEYLSGIARQLDSQLPGRVTHEVLSNEPDPLAYPPPVFNTVADVLARHAVEHVADLIVMTTHGHGGVRRAWLGSAADSLMRIAPLPVLLLRPDDERFGAAADADRGIGHIVIPLDGSDVAERAIPYAQQLGELFGAKYTLLRVVSPLAFHVSSEQFGAYASVPVSPLNRDAAAQYLERVAGRLREAELSVMTRIVDAVSPGSAISNYAATHGADLIVLSSAGAGGVRRLLLGSVADKVVRSGEVPVLVCNVRQIDSAAEPSLAAAAEAT